MLRNRCGRGVTLERSGRFADERGESDWRGGGHAIGDDRVVAAMRMAAAGLTFFLYVGDFAARRHLAITANDAAAAESSESEQTNQTHRVLRMNG